MDSQDTIALTASQWVRGNRNAVIAALFGEGGMPGGAMLRRNRLRAAQRVLAVYVHLRDDMEDPNAAASFYHTVMGS